VVIQANGSLTSHQQAVGVKSRVAAREVAKLFKALEINDLFRLRLYLQSFVDSQFYALELLPLPIALEISRARAIFVCEFFNLPRCTSRNMVYVLFPVIPPVFLLAKRRLAFYKRAQTHDLNCVKEAFLFDLSFLYPHHASWTAQTKVILEELGLNLDERRMNFEALLESVVATTSDIEKLCFRHVLYSEDSTMTFFRIFPDVDTARDFRNFLSGLSRPLQDFLLLFLSSGLRWRFFTCAERGQRCPLCPCSFWSWEHFLQCSCTAQRSTLFLEFSAAAYSGDWGGILDGVRCVVLTWVGLLERDSIIYSRASIEELFSGSG
jgi:hypothetical protein